MESSRLLQGDLEGSCFTRGAYHDWYRARRFVADLLCTSGPVLDIGCANGYLLECLQLWSGLSIVPYGLDIRADAIAAARSRFPDHAGRFLCADARSLEAQKWFRMLPVASLVYWNLPSDWDLAEPGVQVWIAQVLGSVRADAIGLGVYGKNALAASGEQRAHEREQIRLRCHQLRSLLGDGEVVLNPNGSAHALLALAQRLPGRQ